MHHIEGPEGAGLESERIETNLTPRLSDLIPNDAEFGELLTQWRNAHEAVQKFALGEKIFEMLKLLGEGKTEEPLVQEGTRLLKDEKDLKTAIFARLPDLSVVDIINGHYSSFELLEWDIDLYKFEAPEDQIVILVKFRPTDVSVSFWHARPAHITLKPQQPGES